MRLRCTIVRGDGNPLPQGSSVNVEIRDTSLEDAPAVLLKRASITVPGTGHTRSVPAEIELTKVPDGTTAWAHIDTDGDGRVSKGDYVSVESYPISGMAVQDLTIRVREVK